MGLRRQELKLVAAPVARDQSPRQARARYLARLLAVALALAAVFGASPLQAATTRVKMEGGKMAAITDSQELFLEAPPLRGEGAITFAERLTGNRGNARRITRTNGRRPRRLYIGQRYRIPYEILSGRYKLAVIRALFPGDSPQPAGWRHIVSARRGGLSLWRVALWFTGDGQSFAAIREHNDFRDEELSSGQGLIIPRDILLPAFRATLPPPTVPKPTVPAAAAAHGLEFVRDESGDFAVYRLKKGEALYSAVVVRFTGGTFAEDVNALAGELAKLNKIPDVRDMWVGQPVRIPFDLLLPEFLPADNPRRLEYDKDRSESDKHSNTVRASRLEGITVILDAGHGGQDPGTKLGSTWESVYVYDIMLRVKKLLETTTAATVVPTTRDGSGGRIHDRDVLPRSRDHTVLTTPPYAITDAKIAANLRWYLANSRHAAAVKRTGDSAKTVFFSIHADSLPRSHRGVMAYIPAASLTRGEYGKTGSAYTSRREVKEKPRVSYSWKERTRSEGLSRQLAAKLLDSFKRHGLAIHREKPIRDRIIRCRRCRPWVPAVVRYNAVPAKLLLEVCNLNNSEDRRLMQTREFRQRVAEAIVDGILAYYGQPVGGSAVAAAG